MINNLLQKDINIKGMIANRSEAVTPSYYHFVSSRTPKNKYKDALKKQTRIKQSSSKERKKLAALLDMNKKYQRELVDWEFVKMKEAEKYAPPPSPKKLTKLSVNSSADSISLVRPPRNSSPSKESQAKFKSRNKSDTSIVSNQNFTLLGQKFTQPKVIEKEKNLMEIPESDICISKIVADSWLRSESDVKTGFWIPENKHVSLFPVNSRTIDRVVIVNQPHVLPILGSMTVKKSEVETRANINLTNQQNYKFSLPNVPSVSTEPSRVRRKQKYIVTELYENCTLRDLINEFGALEEETVKHYLRKIILCVWNLHKNKVYHNRLSVDSVIYTESGDILINTLKSSSKNLTEDEKFRRAFHFPPEILLSKLSATNTCPEKNDIWGIGCIALQLLTCVEHRSNFYHPYNRHVEIDVSTLQGRLKNLSQQESRFRFITQKYHPEMSHVKTEEEFMMKDSYKLLEKVQRMIESSENNKTDESIVFIDLCESMEMKELSPSALDFLKKCLNLKASKRSSIDEIMFHPFLKSKEQ